MFWLIFIQHTQGASEVTTLWRFTNMLIIIIIIIRSSAMCLWTGYDVFLFLIPFYDETLHIYYLQEAL